MKKNNSKTSMRQINKQYPVIGNLALKEEMPVKQEYERPKVLKLVISKKENKIFCGCWQIANQEDAC